MVRWPGRYGVWLLVGALAVLLAVLAALQYHWTGEIGRAEADRQRTRLARASQRFSRELGRELGQVMGAFRPEMPGRGATDPRGSLLEKLARWRASEHSELVARLVLVTVSPSGPVAEVVDGQELSFSERPFPPRLEPVRQQLEGLEKGGRSPRGGDRPDTFLTSPPGFLMPVFRPGAGRSSGFGPGAFQLAGIALVELSEDYLRDVLLPELAEIHFGPLGEGDYAVAVLRRQDHSVFYSSDPDLPPHELAHPDVRLDLSVGPAWVGSPRGFDRGFRPGGLPSPSERMRGPRPGRPGSRPEGREAVARPDAGIGEGPRRPGRDWRGDGGMRGPGNAGSPWILVVRHRGGSLAEAVSGVRRRNLGVGLGVLTLLGGAAVLLAVGGQRARRLAHQQLEFVAGVTHELHTPLAAMRSAGQNLADGIISETEQIRRYGELIQKESDRLSALVAQVLDFAGIESGSAAYASAPVPVGALVSKVVGDMTLVLEQAGVTAEVEVAAGIPDIRGDADALQRALENLIGNATKFAREGGWVGIRARRGPGHTVALRVEDRGGGIPRSERGRIFEPFYRGRDARQSQSPGSGLGLSLVRHVAEAHGGRVSVEAGSGGGAAVVVELPAVQDETEGSA